MRVFLSYLLHPNDQQNNQSGLIIMILAMLLVPTVDVLAKILTQSLGPVQVSFIRTLLQTLLVMLILLQSPAGAGSLRRLTLALKIRLSIAGVLISTAITFMMWSLKELPVANAIALFFIEPLLLMALSGLILKERTPWVRYLAAIVGLIGAMVVIRPNWQLYGFSAVLPMLAALCYALHFIVIRKCRDHLQPLQIQAGTGIAGILFLGLLLIAGNHTEEAVLHWSHLQSNHLPLLALLGAVSAISYLMINVAFHRSAASTLAPFQYLEIVSATFLGFLVFSEYPDTLTLVGTGIILGAGLFVIGHEQKSNPTKKPVM
ncbi:DMT family transporter [Oceanospirillum sp.]|uniref:DMT family transporter n=1 Tax=Oceanospirillum sp. TaxID=2021254 RepID=UPI003A8D7468